MGSEATRATTGNAAQGKAGLTVGSVPGFSEPSSEQRQGSPGAGAIDFWGGGGSVTKNHQYTDGMNLFIPRPASDR